MRHLENACWWPMRHLVSKGLMMMMMMMATTTTTMKKKTMMMTMTTTTTTMTMTMMMMMMIMMMVRILVRRSYPKYPLRDQTSLICRWGAPKRYDTHSAINSAISGQWLNIAGYQEGIQGFWLANCEYGYGSSLNQSNYWLAVIKPANLAQIGRCMLHVRNWTG